MKTRAYILFFLLNLMYALSFAQKVSISDAEKIANIVKNNFFKNSKSTSSSSLKCKHIEFIGNDEVAWYVFSGDNNYVIVSGDKRAYPIIGFSDESSFSDTASLPPGFKDWLAMRKEEMKQIVNSNNAKPLEAWEAILSDNSIFNKAKSKEVKPLLLSSWGQDCFYNEACPYDPLGPCERTYAGCVAAATAQVMYYHRYPHKGIGSNSYETLKYGVLSADFSQTTYKWEEMRSSINSSAPEIAKLLYHVAISVNMAFGPQGSASTTDNAAKALVENFGFADDILHACRRNYQDSVWHKMMQEDLDNGLPIIYIGRPGEFQPGHAFVCDGYKGENFYHFDWGWSGADNGYFYIDNLNPPNQNFNFGQCGIFKARPAEDIYLGCSGSKKLTGRIGSFNDGSGARKKYYPNANCSWLIQPQPPIERIKLNFYYFETEKDKDIVRIYEGTSEEGKLIGQYSGFDIPPAIETTAESLFITFQSDDSIEYKGWQAEYIAYNKKFCSLSKNISDPEGIISDGSEDYNYENNTMCMWNIIVPGAKEIIFEFKEFDTEKDNDVVKIIDLNTNQLVAQLSGSELPDKIHVKSNKVRIQFVTNSTITGKGWKLIYYSSTDVDETVKSSSIKITPDYSNKIVNIVKFSDDINLKSLEIYDVTGRLIEGKALSNDTYINKIDISNFSKGIYIFKVITENELINEKIFIGN